MKEILSWTKNINEGNGVNSTWTGWDIFSFSSTTNNLICIGVFWFRPSISIELLCELETRYTSTPRELVYSALTNKISESSGNIYEIIPPPFVGVIFSIIKLPGGVELNGRQIYDDAEKELDKIKEVMSNTYELPPFDMIGWC